MANYIVTGAAGFIGSCLARKLIDQNHFVVTIDNLSTGFKENIPKGVHFIKGDCGHEDSLKKIPDLRYDAIYHIAGQSSGEISFDDPIYDVRTNTLSTLLLLNFALKKDCPRFIYTSTMSVYGEQPNIATKEDSKCIPTSFYGVGKLASEQYLKLYQNHGLKTTSLRLFNVYGPGQNLSNLRQGMVSIFLAQLFNDSCIQMKGSPDRYRDFVYIDDVITALTNCLTDKASENKTINIGTGKRTYLSELTDMMFHLTEREHNLKVSGTTPGDLNGIFADTSKMRSLLNLRNIIPLDVGLKRMIEWIGFPEKELS